MTEVRKDAIVRSRPAGVGDGRSDLEVGMLFALRASGLPLPAQEHHFDWCCELTAALHVRGMRGRGHEFRRGRDWRFDFAWPELFVALEVEGGTFAPDDEEGGRHTRGVGFEEDCEKYAEAAIAGWTVLRVTGAMVDDGRALDYLERLLAEKGIA